MIGVDTEFGPHPLPTASQTGTHPQWTLEYRSNARGMRGAQDLNGPAFPAEAAVRLALPGGEETFRTTLFLPDRGRFHMAVRYQLSHLDIRVDCDTRLGYDWLSRQRRQLECGLMHTFGRPTRMDVTLRGCA